MACNRFGQLFAVTTFGESHGKGIGAVVDGCPAGLEIDLEMIQKELDRRKPGGVGVSPRREEDRVSILSGVFEGRTTGAPIALWIENRDVDSSKYDRVHKPGHASRTYLQKYGVFDYLGGGRSSGRETAARVAAGAIAKKLIAPMEVRTIVRAGQAEEGDSIGGIVEGEIVNVVAGLGDPVYQKMEAMLAFAMLSIPASRGFEVGMGFAASGMRGSEHNQYRDGTLGGITTGELIQFRVAFKPTSSIQKPQETEDFAGNPVVYKLPEGSRHDPCIAIRAAVVVESMAALVLADAWLMSCCSKI